jgi:hypothetical protein
VSDAGVKNQVGEVGRLRHGQLGTESAEITNPSVETFTIVASVPPRQD